MLLDPRLARLLAARLCHDLGGLSGALDGMLDLMDGGDPEMKALGRETVDLLRLRIKLYGAALGGGAEDALDAAGLHALLQGAPSVPRVGFDLSGFGPGAPLDGATAALVLTLAMLAAEALPRGGMVHLDGAIDTGLAALPAGAGAAWPPGLLAVLAGAAPDTLLEGGPRQALLPLFLAQVEEAGWHASLGLGAGPGAAPLMVGPRR